jgi:hypothetical protein
VLEEELLRQPSGPESEDWPLFFGGESRIGKGKVQVDRANGSLQLGVLGCSSSETESKAW